MHAVIDKDVLRKPLQARSVPKVVPTRPFKFSCLTPLQEVRISAIREEKFTNKIALTPSEEKFLFEVFSGLTEMLKELDSGSLSGRSRQVARMLEDAVTVRESLLELITQTNRRLAFSLAVKLSEKLNFRVRPEDLARYGDDGLPIAIRRFDHGMGNRFSTYAKWWINKCMYDAVPMLLKDVSTPSSTADTVRHIRVFSYGFLQSNQREPTEAEIAEGLGLSMRSVEKASKSRLIQSTVPQHLLRSRFMGPEMLVLSRERRDAVRQALKCLTKVELHVISRHFGLGDVEEETLPEIGKNYMDGRVVTKEAVWEVKERALGKLKRALCTMETMDGLHSPSGPHNFRFLSD